MAGIGPEDVDVIQLQDTDAGAEVIHLAENGFCADGDQEALVADGALEIGGPLPVNTDGGLIANGEPIGASGLRQVHEVVLQLRGQAGDRQVPGQPEGRLHAALRRARHRRRVDPVGLSAMDTRDTPEQAELRRSARQLARELGPRDRGRPRRRDARASASPPRCATPAGSSCATTAGDGAPLASGVEAAIVADALGGARRRRRVRGPGARRATSPAAPASRRSTARSSRSRPT